MFYKLLTIILFLIIDYNVSIYAMDSKLLEQCDKGFIEDCLTLAYLYESDSNIKKAYEFYEKACELGDDKVCYKLAIHYLVGSKVEEDIDKAVKFYKKACDLGNIKACVKTSDVSNNPQDNFKYAELSCKHGHPKGCLNLGYCYYLGLGVKKNKSKANEIFDDLCHKYNGACYEIGKVFSSDKIKNYEKALKFFTISCEKNNYALACNKVASMYEKGIGVKPDKVKAEFYYGMVKKR